MISNLWVQGRLLRRNIDLAENQEVSRNQLKKGGLVAGRVFQAEGTVWLKVLKQKGAEFMRRWRMGVKGLLGQGDSGENSGASLLG